MQKIIISILHYNNSKDTINCLKSLTGLVLSGLEIETFVLDNGSKDGLTLNISDFSKINLTVLKNPKNSGFTGGHNLVYEKVQDKEFDFFLLLNNDSIMESHCLKILTEKMDTNGIGAVVPKIYFTKGMEFHKNKYEKNELGKVFWYAGGYVDWNNVQSKHRGVDEVDKGQYDEECEIDFATGACLLLKKEVIRQIKLFDERYFLYFEDADLSQRILKAGYKILYEPKAILWHNNAGSSGSGSSLHDYYLTRNRMLFGMKHASLKMKAHLVRESIKLLTTGRQWQKKGIQDFYLQKFGAGSFRP